MNKNRFASFRSQILNWNRPEGLIRIYSLTYLLTYLLTYSLTHSLTYL